MMALTKDAPASTRRLLYRDPICVPWTRVTNVLHSVISGGVTVCALHAVRYPKTYIGVISVLSLALITTGLLTNFELVLDLDRVLTPVNSKPQLHADWIHSADGFPHSPRLLQMVLHHHGDNVLHVSQARRVLQAIHQIRTTPGYDDLCRQGQYRNFDDELTCRIWSVSGYWNDHSLEEFDRTVGTDDDLHRIVSASRMADGSPVLHDAIIGKFQLGNATNSTRIVGAQSFLVRLEFPNVPDADAFERQLLPRLDALRREWMSRDDIEAAATTNSALEMDFVTVFAYQMEFVRTITTDLYLVALSALFMVGFTCATFYRSDPHQSRALLGVGSVVTIVCSVMAGNGLMFIVGVPYSTVHQMLPFIIFGVGLDDTFIIMGAYLRTSTTASIEDRIRHTMQEVGWSIFLTTLTTVLAFVLGYFSSSFPGVHWLCLSAVTTIALDFYFQITYFVALLVLDERRLQANKRDGFFWMDIPSERDDGKTIVSMDQTKSQSGGSQEDVDASCSAPVVAETIAPQVVQPQPVGNLEKTENSTTADDDETVPVADRSWLEKLMTWYAKLLLLPVSKAVVLVLFAVFFALCTVSATNMTQQFDVGSYVMEDSYLRNIFSSLNDYTNVVRPMAVYFRHVDQSSPEIQRQMVQYVTDMEALPQVFSLDNATGTSGGLADWESGGSSFQSMDKIRPFCWVRDFQELDRLFGDQPLVQAVFDNLTFAEKLDFLLTDKTIREVYGQDIVRDELGNIVTSRCYLFLHDLDLKDVQAQIEMLFDQREVTDAQPINQQEAHKRQEAFFAYDELFGFWQAYTVSVNELISTIISGVVALAIISFVFIPHWTGAVLICPLTIILYIEMLGCLNFLGLHINGITYVCIVVSIGLLVDFLIHVLLRYYECAPGQTRDERVKETLETMGASILVGGATTFLAVVPLAFSSIKIFMTVFNSFFAMVTLGMTHGLILLPVILSLVGPTTNVRYLDSETAAEGSNVQELDNPTAMSSGNMTPENMETEMDVREPDNSMDNSERTEVSC